MSANQRLTIVMEPTCLHQKAAGKHNDTPKANSRPELDGRIGLTSRRGTARLGTLEARGVTGRTAGGIVVHCESENRGDTTGEGLHRCYTRVEEGTDAFAAGVLP